MGLHRYTTRSFGRELMMIAAAIAFCVPLNADAQTR